MGIADGANGKERRQAIFERVKAKLLASGYSIDGDARFMTLVDQWIEGRIEISEVTRGYDEIRRASRHTRPSSIGHQETSAADASRDAKDELARIIGIFEIE